MVSMPQTRYLPNDRASVTVWGCEVWASGGDIGGGGVGVGGGARLE